MSNTAVARAGLTQYDAQMHRARAATAAGITAADLVAIAAPLQLYPGWLPDGAATDHRRLRDPRRRRARAGPARRGAAPGRAPVRATRQGSRTRRGGRAAAAMRAWWSRPGATTWTRSSTTAEAAGVALMVAPDETSWRDVDKLVSAVVDAQSTATPAYAEVRPGDLFALANAIAYSVGGATSIEDHNGRMFAYSNLPHQKIDDIRLQSITERQTPTREGRRRELPAGAERRRSRSTSRAQPEHASRLAHVGARGRRAARDDLGPRRRPAAAQGSRAGAGGRRDGRRAAPPADPSAGERASVEPRARCSPRCSAARIGPGAASALVGLPTATPTTVLAISADEQRRVTRPWASRARST